MLQTNNSSGKKVAANEKKKKANLLLFIHLLFLILPQYHFVFFSLPSFLHQYPFKSIFFIIPLFLLV